MFFREVSINTMQVNILFTVTKVKLAILLIQNN